MTTHEKCWGWDHRGEEGFFAGGDQPLPIEYQVSFSWQKVRRMYCWGVTHINWLEGSQGKVQLRNVKRVREGEEEEGCEGVVRKKQQTQEGVGLTSQDISSSSWQE